MRYMHIAYRMAGSLRIIRELLQIKEDAVIFRWMQCRMDFAQSEISSLQQQKIEGTYTMHILAFLCTFYRRSFCLYYANTVLISKYIT